MEDDIVTLKARQVQKWWGQSESYDFAAGGRDVGGQRRGPEASDRFLHLF